MEGLEGDPFRGFTSKGRVQPIRRGSPGGRGGTGTPGGIQQGGEEDEVAPLIGLPGHTLGALFPEEARPGEPTEPPPVVEVQPEFLTETAPPASPRRTRGPEPPSRRRRRTRRSRTPATPWWSSGSRMGPAAAPPGGWPPGRCGPGIGRPPAPATRGRRGSASPRRGRRCRSGRRSRRGVLLPFTMRSAVVPAVGRQRSEPLSANVSFPFRSPPERFSTKPSRRGEDPGDPGVQHPWDQRRVHEPRRVEFPEIPRPHGDLPLPVIPGLVLDQVHRPDLGAPAEEGALGSLQHLHPLHVEDLHHRSPGLGDGDPPVLEDGDPGLHPGNRRCRR